MTISLLEDSLKVDIYFDKSDLAFEDDICVSFVEDAPEDERLFRADETNIYITPEQAGLLILALQRAMEAYRESGQED